MSLRDKVTAACLFEVPDYFVRAMTANEESTA